MEFLLEDGGDEFADEGEDDSDEEDSRGGLSVFEFEDLPGHQAEDEGGEDTGEGAECEHGAGHDGEGSPKAEKENDGTEDSLENRTDAEIEVNARQGGDGHRGCGKVGMPEEHTC